MHQTAHPIQSISRNGNQLTMVLGDDVPVGRAKIDAIERQTLKTKTALPLAPIYVGTTLSDDQFASHLPVRGVTDGSIQLAQPSQSIHAGDVVWLADIGPGDKVVIHAMGEWMAKSVFGQ